MNNYTGFVKAAAQIGLTSIIIKPNRGILNPVLPDGSTMNDIFADAVVEERHLDELEITQHPVEQGATISDHAYKRPAEVILRLGWSNSPPGSGLLGSPLVGAAAAVNSSVRSVANIAGIAVGATQAVQSILTGSSIDQIRSIYQQLLQLQALRALFTLYTGKRVYNNMLCRVLSTETDFTTENSLPITMVCHQIILVNTQIVSLPPAIQRSPEQTSSTADRGRVSAAPSNKF